MTEWIKKTVDSLRLMYSRTYTAHSEHVLLTRHILTEPISPITFLPDEPSHIGYRGKIAHDTAGGLSLTSHEHARRACMAEALERYLWSEDVSLLNPIITTYANIIARGDKALNPRLLVDSHTQNTCAIETTELPWISMYDHTSRGYVWAPASYVSAAARHMPIAKNVPLYCTTTGLATHPNKTTAYLSGILECIERDAFMCAWLSRYTPLVINEGDISIIWPQFKTASQSLEKYGLKARYSLLPTDAPTYVALVTIEDTRALKLHIPMPYITVGTAAHASIHIAFEKALLEAMRARSNARYRYTQTPSVLEKDPKTLVHTERGVYWMHTDRAQRELSFLIQGDTCSFEKKPWDGEAARQHLNRIRAWAQNAQYPVLTFDFSNAEKNPLSWTVIMTRMPDLQPLYMHEAHPVISMARINVLQALYAKRTTNYNTNPHPFV